MERRDARARRRRAPSPSRSCTVGTGRCGRSPFATHPACAAAHGRSDACFAPASVQPLSVAAPPDANVFFTVSGRERFVASLRDDSSGDAGSAGAIRLRRRRGRARTQARPSSATGTRCHEPGPGSRAARLAGRAGSRGRTHLGRRGDRRWPPRRVPSGSASEALRLPGGNARLLALAVRPQPLPLDARART